MSEGLCANDPIFDVPPLPTDEQVKRFGMDGDGPYHDRPGRDDLDTAGHPEAPDRGVLAPLRAARSADPADLRGEQARASALPDPRGDRQLHRRLRGGIPALLPRARLLQGGRRAQGASWTPSASQLARLEELFATGMGTPNGDLRTKITDELAKLGPVNEANVYNWFQNKKARTKKKLLEEQAAKNRSG